MVELLIDYSSWREGKRLNSFLSELRRRNVFKVAIAYLMLSWLILQLVDVISPLVILPEWVGGFILVLLIILFPITLIIAWAFELTPDGIKKSEDVDEEHSIRQTTGQKINYIIIGFLILVIGFQFWSADEQPVPQEGAIDEPALTEDTIPVNSIAVLPFINMSSDPEQEYFSDGISEEILNVLAQIKDLRVTSRSSSFQFKGEGQDLPAVARQLGVSKILEGSVRKSGNRIRITAQLIEAETDIHLWSETYDRDLSDIFAVQDEISKEIVDALKTTLNIDTANVNFAQGTANTEAHDEYLLGNYLFSTRSVENVYQAKSHFERATILDSDYALPWARLSRVHEFLSEAGRGGIVPYAEAMKQAEIAVNKAAALNAELPEVQHALGYYYRFTYDYEKALLHFERSIELNPNFADGYREIGRLFVVKNQLIEGQKYLEIAARIDPMSLVINQFLAYSYIKFERIEDVQSIVSRIKTIDNSSTFALGTELVSIFAAGQYNQVIKTYRDWTKRFGSPNFGPITRAANALATIGLYDEIVSMLSGTREELEAYYVAGDYDQFIKLVRTNYLLDTLNRVHLADRALAELIAGNHQMAVELYESLGVCKQPIRYRRCQNLYYAKQVLGENEAAETYLKKIKNIENRANLEGWRLNQNYPNEIVEAHTLVMEGEIEAALSLYKSQLKVGFFDYEIMAPHFKELHEHPDWPAFLADIKTFQANQQAKLAELEAGL